MTKELTAAACPAEVLEAIAWYPDELPAALRGAVEAHAAGCAECRREISFVTGEGDGALEGADAERVWARVLDLVSSEAGEATLPAAKLAPPRRAGARWLRSATRPLPIAASIALALGVGALGTLAGSLLESRGGATYQVATAPPVGAPPAGPRVDVVFRGDARASEIQEALRSIGGDVIEGPTALGVYRVALHPGTDPAQAAASLRSDTAHVATFAEPAP